MRKQLVKKLATISFLIAIAIVPIRFAQGESLAYGLRINIPFDFNVGDKQLPAGEYVIRRTQQHSDDSALTISSVDGSAVIVRLTSAVQTLDPKHRGMLVFHRYEDQHFLFQVWAAGSSTGRVFTRSRSERDAARRVLSMAPTLSGKALRTETVTVFGGPQ
jgi:hypothetical protein